MVIGLGCLLSIRVEYARVFSLAILKFYKFHDMNKIRCVALQNVS